MQYYYCHRLLLCVKLLYDQEQLSEEDFRDLVKHVTAYDFLPFMILPIYTTLCKIDKSYVEAASDLGASPAEVFFKVTLPLSMPGIISGIMMVFLPAMTNYVILDMMYNSTYIMGSLVGSYFSMYDWNNGSVISMILLILILLLSTVTGEFSDKEDNAYE